MQYDDISLGRISDFNNGAKAIGEGQGYSTKDKNYSITRA